MVAAKLLISLCVAGLTAGAPQSQQAIVGNVVTALQPSIARAVAEALRGLGGSSSTNTVATSSTGFTSGSRSSGSSSSGSSFSSAGATGAVRASDDIYVNPAYQFEYKVADDAAQTYISQTESRDGDDVTGTYSYVDPNGDLITVNYRAGIDGFSQTTDKQAGAVAMRSQEARSQIATSSITDSSSSVGRKTSTIGGSRNSISGGSRTSNTGSSTGSFVSRSSTTSSSAGINQSDLIAQILSVLQPQITAVVNTAVNSQ